MFFSIYHWVHYIFSFSILRSRILFCCIVTFELFIIIVWTFRLFPRLGYWFVLHPKNLLEFKSLHLRTCVYLCACPIHTCVLWTYIFMFPQYVLYWLSHLPTTIKNFFRCLIFIAKLFILKKHYNDQVCWGLFYFPKFLLTSEAPPKISI